MKKYLTIDVGGSAVKYALMEENANIIEKDKVPTPKTTLEDFVEVIGKLYDKYKDQIEGIAMSLPGIIDPKKGYNYTGGALAYIDKLETVKVLQQRCDCKITIGNDAKCAANAEIGFGALKDVQDACVVILGTGIGGCLVKDHKVHTGRHFSAGEFSFLQMDNVGEYDWNKTWAQVNGIKGLLRSVQDATGSDEVMSGEEIFAKANIGDEKVIAGINYFARGVAMMIYNVHVIFDCEKVAIGGGISAQPLLIDLIRKNMDEIMDKVPFDFPLTNIVPCEFRNDANLIGAMYQFKETFE